MRATKFVRTLLCTGLVLFQAFQTTAQAADEEGDEFSPYIGFQFGHDSNVLRMDDNEPPPQPFDSKRSSYSVIEAGASGAAKVSNQKFLFEGNVYYQRFDDLEPLDHTGGEGELAWNWVVGEPWSGTVGYHYVRELRDFEDMAKPNNGLRDTGTISVGVVRLLTRKLGLEFDGDLSDIEIDGEPNQNSDRSHIAVRMPYELSPGRILGLGVQRVVRNADSSSDSSDFTKTKLGPYLRWSLAEESHFEASVEYEDRNGDTPNEKDFQGLVGRAGLTWQLTEKTRLTSVVWRETSNLNDEISNYAVIDAIRVEPAWQATERVRLAATAMYQNRDFRGQAPSREDRILLAGASVMWEFHDRSSATLRFDRGHRDSNAPTFDYRYDLVNLEVRLAL